MSASVAVLRLLAAAVVGLAVPALHVELTNLVLIGAVFGVAAVYERLKQRATGWAQEAPPRLRPATIGLVAAGHQGGPDFAGSCGYSAAMHHP